MTDKEEASTVVPSAQGTREVEALVAETEISDEQSYVLEEVFTGIMASAEEIQEITLATPEP